MIALSVVVDTNVVISAALKAEGLERSVALLALAKPARWYVSEPIMKDYAAVLARAELKIRKGLRLQFLQLIKNHAHVVVPAHLPQLTADAADNILLECADAARADYLITGNQRHFPKFWKKTKVINSRDFLSVVAPHLT
jgi:uncharacterized protein